MTFKPTDYLPYDFANRRHIGPSVEEINEMLKYLKVDTLDDLIEQTIPEKLRQKKTANVGES
jgi:glycine dehydrogenase